MRLSDICIFVVIYNVIDLHRLTASSIYLEDVKEALNSSDTLTYLSTFNFSDDKYIIYKHLESCPLNPVCEHRLTINKHYFGFSCCSSCSCDYPDCLSRMTCCLDILFRRRNTIGDSLMDKDYDESNPDNTCVPEYIGDLSIIRTGEIDYQNMGLYMVSNCPDDTPEYLVKNCTRPYSFDDHGINDVIPVTHVLTGVIYRNMYCAYCNNLKDSAFRSADVLINCLEIARPLTENGAIKSIQENTCIITFKTNNHDSDLACTERVEECNKTGNWHEFDGTIQDACNLYLQLIYIDGKSYKNPFCAMCNGVNITDFVCSFAPSLNKFTFSGLLKLENYYKVSSPVSGGKCNSNQIYDSTSNVCRDIHCPPFTFLNNGECRESYSEVRSVKYNLYLKIIPLEPITVKMAYMISEDIRDYIGSLSSIIGSVCGIQVMQHCQENILYKSYEEIQATEIEYFKARVQSDTPEPHSQITIYEDYYQLHNTKHSIWYFDRKINNLKKLEVLLMLDDFNSKMFNSLANLSVTNTVNDMNLTYPTDKLLPLKLILDHFIVANNHTGLDIPHITDSDYSTYMGANGLCVDRSKYTDVNLMYYKRCPKVIIPQDEAVWVRTDDGIMFVKGTFYVRNSDFFMDFKGNVILCSDIYKEYISLFKEAPTATMQIVSIVFSSMSILALSITLTVLLLIPRIRRNIPGRINISLVVVLLCAQCMYLVGSFAGVRIGTWECIIIGIVLHYLWILFFMWTNISTYHMYHVITQMKIMSNTSGVRRFVVYHVYAAIMAALPVLINIIVSLIFSDTTGYGDAQCYISSQIMIVCTFAIPLALVLICNVSMYVLVVFIIRRPTTIQKTVKRERNDLIIFVKLSTLTGATWLFGLIYSWTNFIPLSYVSIVLNAGQGVFIMYSLILNKRVLNLFISDVLGRNETTQRAQS